jgi:hypothetical protein
MSQDFKYGKSVCCFGTYGLFLCLDCRLQHYSFAPTATSGCQSNSDFFCIEMSTMGNSDLNLLVKRGLFQYVTGTM